MGTTMRKPSKIVSAAALSAAFAMAATPVAAVELPYTGGSDVEVQTGAAADQSNQRWRRYRPRHGYRHHHRHRSGVDAGDVVAGVLILGAIAAIASSGRDRDRDDDRDRNDRDYGDRDYDYNDRAQDSRGLRHAADMCMDQIERGRNSVEDIDSARRTSDGWRVAGTLENGGSWNCWIDNDGRIRDVDIGVRGFSSQNADDRYASGPFGDQWDDSAYSRARNSTTTPSQNAYTYRSAENRAPAYRGGPIPGEEGYAVDEGDSYGEDGYTGSSDGRYSTGQTPDFSQPGR